MVPLSVRADVLMSYFNLVYGHLTKAVVLVRKGENGCQTDMQEFLILFFDSLKY